MSYTSEEESEINFQQQHKLAVCEPALGKGNPSIPWKLKQTSSTEAKRKVYICPEVTCPHHDASRALGDLTGIKKHYSRKHGEKKWKCERCSKKYAVQSDWRAHTKICGTKEYRCDCGTIFSRKDSFITHRAFCDALTEDNSRINQTLATMVGSLHGQHQDMFSHTIPSASSSPTGNFSGNSQISDKHLRSISPYTFMARTTSLVSNQILPSDSSIPIDGSEPNSPYMSMSSPYMSATALLQKASEMGAKTSEDPTSPQLLKGFPNYFTSRSHIGISSGILGTSTANGDRKKTAENNSPYMNSPWAGSGIRPNNTVPWIGLPPFSMRAENRGENRSSDMADEDQMQQNAHESIFGVRGMGLTQDFLGLGGNGNVQMSDDIYNGDTSLSYSDEQQKSQEDIYSYHQ